MPISPPAKPRNGNHKSNSKNQRDWNNFEFANVKLTGPQQDAFHPWFEKHNADIADRIRQLLEGNHKITVSADVQNACYIASFTCKDELSPNYGYVLTSRSDDWWEAMALCVFKDSEICGDKAWHEAGDTNNWG